MSDYKQLHGRFDSIDAQIEVCTEFIKRHADEGWFLAEAFIDPAYTAKNMKRPGMRALQEAIVAGRIKVVVSFKLERMLRSDEEWPAFRRLLREHGCQFVSVSEGPAEDTASGRLKTSMLVSVAAYERENTAEKVRSKMVQQAKKGIWNGGIVPYGYGYDTRSKRLAPHPVEGPIVRQVYTKAAELVSLTDVANDLHAQGISTRARTVRTRHGELRQVGGRRIRSDWLRQLIQNPLYRGRIRYKADQFPGLHEPLVTTELWEAANAAIRETPKRERRVCVERDRHFNVLKGLVVCGDCGRALVPAASGKRSPEGDLYRYYICSAVQKERSGAECRVRRVNAPALERCVIGLLCHLAHHPKIVKSVLDAGCTKALGEVESLERRLDKLETDLGRCVSQLQNLVDALAAGGLAAIGDELRSRIADVKARKDALLMERARLLQERNAWRQEQLAPETICAALKRFDTLWVRFSNDEKRELVSLLIARVEVRVPRCDSTNVSPAMRELQLRIKLHLPELMSNDVQPSATQQKLLILDAAIQVPKGSSGEIVITAPFRHALTSSRAERMTPPDYSAEVRHPIHRALALKKACKANPSLTNRQLAKREGLSPAMVGKLLALLGLDGAIQKELLTIRDRRTAWRYSIRKLLPLVALEPAVQLERFREIGNRNRRRCAFKTTA